MPNHYGILHSTLYSPRQLLLTTAKVIGKVLDNLLGTLLLRNVQLVADVFLIVPVVSRRAAHVDVVVCRTAGCGRWMAGEKWDRERTLDRALEAWALGEPRPSLRFLAEAIA